jgi:hypothetical protein
MIIPPSQSLSLLRILKNQREGDVSRREDKVQFIKLGVMSSEEQEDGFEIISSDSGHMVKLKSKYDFERKNRKNNSD